MQPDGYKIFTNEEFAKLPKPQEEIGCKPNIPLYLTGVIQTGDNPNRNGRIYPWEYLKREYIRYMDNEVKDGLSYGELNHPENSATPFDDNPTNGGS
jgi:hypothetical protein